MGSNEFTKLILSMIAIVFGLVFLTQNSASRLVSAKSGGAELYQQRCITCHGADGKAKTPKGIRKGATDLTKSSISSANAIKVITNGREQMPEFKGVLTAAEITEVAAYIRGFRKK